MIPVFQREIVEIPFLLPDGTFKPHPALVVSVPELQEEEEGLFYAVLISTKNHHPKYTIEIKAEDIVNRPSIDRKSYFVTHIITYFLTRDIIQRKGYFVTKSKFNEVVDTVINNIFGEPLNEK